MNKIELWINNGKVLKENLEVHNAIENAVHEKEIAMWNEFERRLAILNGEVDEEMNKLMDSHQKLANEIDKLAEFILTEVEGEPSENEGAVDTAIRLLKECIKR
jgi:hypothetical protein